MTIKAFSSGPLYTNAMVLSCESSKKAAIIDPAPESFSSLVEYIQSNDLDPAYILLTHSHFDHIGDLKKTKNYFKVPVYVHDFDKANVLEPGADGIPFFSTIPPTEVDGSLVDGQFLELGSLKIKVIHTPGHSPGGVCFYIKEQKLLISGDTLFKGSIGNLSLPTSSPKDMRASLQTLAKLPAETAVYPGHGDPTTLHEESWISAPEKFFSELNIK